MVHRLLYHAIKHLYPEAVVNQDFALRDDGNGPYIAEWYLPDPQPTEAELDQAEQDYLSAVAAEQDAADQLKAQIRAAAQSAVGVTLNDLTAAQQRALLAIVLWQAGAVASDLTIRPLGEWVR